MQMNLATYRTQAVQRFFKLNSYLFSMLSNFARLQSVSLQREKLLEGDSEKFFCTVHCHLTSFNMSHLMALHGRPPSYGAKWQRQASHSEGKSDPVKTGLTSLTAMALV